MCVHGFLESIVCLVTKGETDRCPRTERARHQLFKARTDTKMYLFTAV